VTSTCYCQNQLVDCYQISLPIFFALPESHIINSCRGGLHKLHWSLSAGCGIISKKIGI